MKRTSILVTFLSVFFTFAMQAQNTLRMTSNQRLDKGQKIEVAGKGFLSMQTDGNLVAYNAANAAKWASGTYGSAVTHVIMQTDGNLVIYNNSNPVWASNTWNQANNGYFEIDLNTWRVAVFRPDGTMAKELQTPTATVVLSDPTTINVTSTSGTTALKFPRQQNWEAKFCQAYGMAGGIANYTGLTPFQQAIGSMGLDAAEAYFKAVGMPNITPQQAFDKLAAPFVMGTNPDLNAVTGVLSGLIMDKLKLNQNDAHSIALREWAVKVYRQMKVDVAIGTLKEYYTWKADPCTYSAPGYTMPDDCFAGGQTPHYLMWKTNKPPSDLLKKAGLAYAAGNSPQIVNGVSGAVGGIAWLGGTLLTASTLTSQVSLFSAFGGAGGSGAIGAVGWAGVIAGPAAIIATGVAIGVSQGIAVIEGEQAEWKLKQAIRANMSENINLANVLPDQYAGALFLIGVVKSAQNGWKAPSLDFDGEVTFFSEAGYVSKFYLTYTLNGQPKSFSTNDMSTGYWQKFTIPASAKNIEVKGVMISAGEHQIFKQTLASPSYVCYKVYGTVFKQEWSNDWPLSVGGEVSSTAGVVKFIHGAGFVANWQITYNLPGKPLQNVNPTGTTFGWNKSYNIPLDATNVRILIQGATGLAWEPWRTTYDKTFPTVPNTCIKIYGTTLDQRWNSDCN